MAVHFEAQEEEEVVQIRSRELQLESIEKMEKMVPVVENIDSINFDKIESNANEIKNMVTNNLEQQPDISELYNMIEDLSKNLSTIKGQITKVSNKITELSNSIDENKE